MGSDGQFDRSRVVPGGDTDLLELVIAVFHLGWVHMPGGVPGIGVLRGELQHARTATSDQDGRTIARWATRTQHTVMDLVILPLEIYPSFTQQWCNHLHGLLEAAGKMIEGIAKCLVLRLMPPGTQAHDQASTTYLIDGIRHLRHQCWRTKGGADNNGAQCNTCGSGCQGAEHRKDLPQPPFLAPWETVDQMIAEPNRIQANTFSSLGQIS